MFNRRAREDFEAKLGKIIPEINKRPKVLTFHALAYSMRSDARKQGLLSNDNYNYPLMTIRNAH